MYIFKNALRCISRAKGRSILIGIIVLAITLSACMGLSIRQAAQNAKDETLDGLSITGTISFDRRSAMKELSEQSTTYSSDSSKNEAPSFDKDSFSEMMNENSSLTLDEYQKYAKAQSVKDFYYSVTAQVNGTSSLEAVSTSSQSENDSQSDETKNNAAPAMPDGDIPTDANANDKKGSPFVQSDFSLIGYSGENAMTDFSSGTITISQGTVFAEGKADNTCIISDELAQYNNLSVGDKIKISNPNDESETYKLKIVGIFTDSSSNESAFSPMSAASNDPSNRIYTSYKTAQKILTKSAAAQSDSENSAIQSSLSASYVFANTQDFESFEQEVRQMGLDEKYTVSSADLESYESSLVPLETLSKTAGYFLIVILAIGAVILIVLSILTVRERKYEIGVLTAMGMKKGKVAAQFIFETLVITMVAVIIGCAIGAVSSVPVTNALLSNQVESSQSASAQVEQNFGRGDKNDSQAPSGTSQPGGMNRASYITSVNSAMNLHVLLEVVGIALLLVLLSGGVSLLFVMRYDPLKILANRD